jgi:hypothetical protein
LVLTNPVVSDALLAALRQLPARGHLSLSSETKISDEDYEKIRGLDPKGVGFVEYEY